MKKKILSFLMIMTIAVGVMAVDIFALEDGVYIVSNTTSYVNPDTGKTDDGGSDTSLGDGMARGMTHETSFYEVIEGKHYITVRIGMVSYIENMRFKVQSEKGKGDYKSISYKVVGENKEEDTRDYRIEIPSIDFRISPTFFVGPMNRDVVFFISFNSASIKEDDGSLGGYTREVEKSNSISTNEETPSTVQESTGISEVHSISEENRQKSTTEVEKKTLKSQVF
ncbi:Cell surface heme-binding protein Shp [Anaerovirgula multivorans]|uniref:Cell surface heme-binding protein Shp n=1 Tax=Anaerovirgula multivorans TaxID=312168 RepID=A0A239HA39_9FIRM|nr:heme-binding Shp domain-containing protein [Anaerovirgula multivorans]SNS77104.1 Cell surface heme-binding protein Shp [Anaerovirgula multivorans]